MIFKYKAFLSDFQKKYEGNLSKEEIENLLGSESEYTSRDKPYSTGKRLIVTRVCFNGEKVDGAKIQFSQEMQNGLNIWVADNLKGKSSLFKIIKFALTGDRNAIKQDVRDWISYVLVSFQIGEYSYTTFIDNRNRSYVAKMYKKTISSIEEALNTSYEPFFETNTAAKYEAKMEEFFFDQFSYYSLKWTQKKSQKNALGLLEAGTSWKTYFKSIFLESKDSSALIYGNQEEKVFQMLLGLELTYPINRLTVKKDMMVSEKSQLDMVDNVNSSKVTKCSADLVEELKEINQKLEKISLARANELNLNNLCERFDLLSDEFNKACFANIEMQDEISALIIKKQMLEKKLKKVTEQQKILSKDLSKTHKSIIDLDEYIAVGMFFSNLDIKHCPSCDNEVVDKGNRENGNNKVCLLCHTTSKKTKINDGLVYHEKNENLKNLKKKIENELSHLDEVSKPIQEEVKEVEDIIHRKKMTLTDDSNHKVLRDSLKSLADEIKKEKSKLEPINHEINNLISKKAVVTYKLEQLSLSSKSDSDKKNVMIDLLNSAIHELKRFRYDHGKNILKSLSKLMLAELREFNLDSITDIKIGPKFDMLFKQDGKDVRFSDISEGEQLRIKLAFYLSLIQLDIEYNFGRHTRFLIIDSPGKEEGDINFLNGLANVLESIQARYCEKLQIFIGTAQRNLSGIVKNETILPAKKNLF